MIVELNKLLNTMKLVETRGDSTKIMADCMRFVEQMIASASAAKVEASEESG